MVYENYQVAIFIIKVLTKQLLFLTQIAKNLCVMLEKYQITYRNNPTENLFNKQF